MKQSLKDAGVHEQDSNATQPIINFEVPSGGVTSPHQKLNPKLAYATSEQHDLKMSGHKRGGQISGKNTRLGEHASRARTAALNLSQMSYDAQD